MLPELTITLIRQGQKRCAIIGGDHRTHFTAETHEKLLQNVGAYLDDWEATTKALREKHRGETTPPPKK